MKTIVKLIAATSAIAGAMMAVPTIAQAAEPGHAIVSLYHAAPGQQEALLRWLADQDRAAAAAGVGPSQLYIHLDGDSWDYMIINPATTDAQDQAIDAAAKRMGIASGPRASLEFRKYILTHTDTYTVGPMTAAQAVADIGASK